MIDANAVQRLLDLADQGEYLDTEDTTPLIEAARMWLLKERINNGVKHHTDSGSDCWCGDQSSFHFISKGRVDRT